MWAKKIEKYGVKSSKTITYQLKSLNASHNASVAHSNVFDHTESYCNILSAITSIYKCKKSKNIVKVIKHRRNP